MDIVLDTCIFLRNDEDQSVVPGFDYNYLEELLSDHENKLFVSCFSLPEIYFLRHCQTFCELMDIIRSNNISIIYYDYSKLRADFSNYDKINVHCACAFYHLTTFLEFFVVQVVLPLQLDTIDSINKVIHQTTDSFYQKLGPITLQSFTKFMKNGSIEYILECLKCVVRHYGKEYSEKQIWQMIANTRINSGIPFQEVDISFIRYAKYLTSLFGKKLRNKADKITLSFGIIDLLIAHASRNGFVVVTSDKDFRDYLLLYGNKTNKEITKKLWRMF